MPGTSATATLDATATTTPVLATTTPVLTDTDTHGGIDDHADETIAPDGGDVLAVDIPGAFIGKRSERLQVRVAGEVVAEAPLFRLRQVIVGSRGVSISSDAIQACARRDITIYVVGRWPGDAAMLGTPVGNATVATRRAVRRVRVGPWRPPCATHRLGEGTHAGHAVALPRSEPPRRRRPPRRPAPRHWHPGPSRRRHCGRRRYARVGRCRCHGGTRYRRRCHGDARRNRRGLRRSWCATASGRQTDRVGRCR